MVLCFESHEPTNTPGWEDGAVTPPARLVVLLPPSEGKAPGGDGPAWDRLARQTDGDQNAPFPLQFPTLDRHRRVVARALAAALRSRRVDNAALLGVRGPALTAGTAAGLTALSSPTLPAVERYTGVLYDALDYPSLSAAGKRRADESLVIVSGLGGVVAPRDLIPDYKLPIGTALPRLGRLGTWWRPRLSPALNTHVMGAVVWDLLPTAHAASWSDGGRAAARWRVRVVREDRAGTRTVISHENKSAKGTLARYLISAAGRGVDPRELADVEFAGGYRLDLGTSVFDDVGGVVDLVAR